MKHIEVSIPSVELLSNALLKLGEVDVYELAQNVDVFYDDVRDVLERFEGFYFKRSGNKWGLVKYLSEV